MELYNINQNPKFTKSMWIQVAGCNVENPQFCPMETVAMWTLRSFGYVHLSGIQRLDN